MQPYLHLLTSLKRFGRYTQTVRYTLRERKFQGTKIPRSKSSIELSFPGAKRPGSERARERIGQGPIGRFAPGSELARKRKGSVPFSACVNIQLDITRNVERSLIFLFNNSRAVCYL